MTGQDSLVQAQIEAEPDAHVSIRIDQGDRPTISLDVSADHGRRALSVRANGMTIASILLDVEELPPLGSTRIQRFCPFCGEEKNIVASVDRHRCSGGME